MTSALAEEGETNAVEMKAWQKGIPMERLLSIERLYEDDNATMLGPFAQMKKNTIADLLARGRLRVFSDCAFALSDVTRTQPMKIYPHGRAFSQQEKGDLRLRYVAGDQSGVLRELVPKLATKIRAGRSVWLRTPAMTDTQQRRTSLLVDQLVQALGVWAKCRAPCGASVTSFSEIFHEHRLTTQPPRTSMRQCDLFTLAKSARRFDSEIAALRDAITKRILPSDFAVHYSNYNARNAWSAVALRGFFSDATRIEKPAEMGDEWCDEHGYGALQDTHLRALIPEADFVWKLFVEECDSRLERVRLMRLSQRGGELQRHTDLVDPSSGCDDGQMMRVHFPIKTNLAVRFTSWDLCNKPNEQHLETGSMWALDTRKPHRAINNGDDERIHLVVDVAANVKVRALFGLDQSPAGKWAQ